MNAVVKVLCVHSKPNFSLPWQRKRQFTSTSSGFMVRSDDGQRWLLTNAHSVEYHAQVPDYPSPNLQHACLPLDPCCALRTSSSGCFLTHML